MKIGIAKDDFGIHHGQFTPIDSKDGFQILKGHKYILPEHYNFDTPGSIFDPDKIKKEK
jgi:hypothetical protein